MLLGVPVCVCPWVYLQLNKKADLILLAVLHAFSFKWLEWIEGYDEGIRGKGEKKGLESA